MNKNIKKAFYRNRNKRKRKENIKFPVIFTFVFIFGYLFFFTSNIWLNNEKHIDNSYKLCEVMSKNDRNIAITSWEYSEEQEKMLIIIEIENLSLDEMDSYRWLVRTQNDNYKTNVVVDMEDFVVLEAFDVDEKDVTMVKMSSKEKDADFDTVRFLCNPSDISDVDSIKSGNLKHYKRKSAKSKIAIYEKEIKSIKKEISSSEKKLNLAEDKIKKLNRKLKFKTGEEKEETISNITNLETNRDILYQDISAKEDEIKSLKEKLKLQRGFLK